MWHNSIKIVEPVRWERAMLMLNNWLHKNYILVQLVPYTADIFVFTYPIYLVALYVWGIGKKKEYYKHAALYIFFSVASAAIVNMVIQFFWDKSRPESALNDASQLILSHLPSDPFPSDHAAVSAAIAMSTLLRGMRHKDELFMRLSIFFWIACGLMSVSRVAVAIHWPTDVLVGIIVGIWCAVILFSGRIRRWLKGVVFPWLIRIEERLVEKLFGIIQ